jgi:hypothetical protein
MNSCLLWYSLDAAERPSMRQTSSGAKTSVMAPVPFFLASNAWRIVSRLASVSSYVDESINR